MKTIRSLPVAVAVVALAAPAFPCAVCFGDPTSPLTRGAAAGVIFLGIMVYLVLMGMAGIAFMWYLRARKLAAQAAAPPATDQATHP